MPTTPGPAEPTAEMRALGASARQMFAGLVAADFTESQACQIIAGMLAQLATGGMKPPGMI